MTTVWSSGQYGYDLIYWITIEGIPVVWSERAAGLALPTGYSSEVAGLVIDDSSAIGSEVDPLGGIGKSLPLSFRLRDSDTARTWLKRWAYEARLTQDHTSGVTTITVDDTTGWPSSGALYIGKERVTYTGKTGTTFTGCTRGVSGLAYPHTYGGAGGLVTNLPRWWRGRLIELWATPVDPAGFVAGPDLDGDAELIWRGYIEAGPRREGLHFAFDALALDRKLAVPLGQRWSGQLVDVEQRYAVSKAAAVVVDITIFNAAGAVSFSEVIVFRPFVNNTDGELLTGTQIRAQCVAAYEQAVSDGGHTATLDSMLWVKHGYPGGADPGLANEIYQCKFTFDANAGARGYRIKVLAFGDDYSPTYTGTVAALVAGQPEPSYWTTTHNPFRQSVQGAQPLRHAVTAALIEGDAGDVPATGIVKVGDEVFGYSKKASLGGLVYLGWLIKIDANGYGSLKPGAEVAIMAADGTFAAPVALPIAAAKMLASSGEANLRSSDYDSLSRGQGYGLPENAVNYHQILQRLGGGLLGQLRVQLAPDDESLEDLIGGLLQLSGRALVMRRDPSDTKGRAKITAIHIGAAFDYAATITDADLLTTGGAPVIAERIDDWPNRVEITCTQAGEDVLRLVYSDGVAVHSQGARSLEVSAPISKPAAITAPAAAWAMQMLNSAQTLQVLRVRVGPWVDVEIGDGVQLQLTHPAIWDWANGKPGYTGAAQCIGRAVRLKTGETEIKLLVGGGVNWGALSPSAACMATDSTINPTYIEVPGQYLDHFSNALAAAGGNIRLLHYRPGQAEGVSEGYNISAAAVSGANCRLTVASKIGSPTLTVTASADPAVSYLTLPESANDDAYQARFMHDADGSQFA